MMMSRHLRRAATAVAAVVVAGAALAGCAGSSGSGDPDSLRLLTYDDATTGPVLQEQLDVFEEETGIEVTLETLPGSGAAVYPDKLRTQLLGGKGPDVWKIWGGTIGGPFTQNKQAADLQEYYDEYGWADTVSPAAIEGMTWDDTIYGLPLWQVSVTVWYDKAAFAEAGITELPTSYDELLAVNDKLVAAGKVPFGLGGKYGWHVMRLFEYLLEKNAGPDLHDKLLTGDASWDDPAVVQSFTELKEWADKGYLPEGVLGVDPADSEGGFTRGESVMMLAGAWVDSTYIQQAADPSNFGTFSLPTGQEPSRHSGWVEGYMINQASTKKDNAAKLLNFLAQPEVQIALQNTQSTVDGAQPDGEKYPASLENAEIGASEPFYTIQDQALPNDLSNAYFDVQSQVIQGTTTPEKAAADMQDAVASILNK